jgi:hypothetical protein
MSKYSTILVVTILQRTSFYVFRLTLAHHQKAHSCVMPPEIKILTSTISYSRRNRRLCDLDGPNFVIYVFTISIALSPFSFKFGSKKLTNACILWSLKITFAFNPVYTVCYSETQGSCNQIAKKTLLI